MPNPITIAALVVAAGLVAFVLVYPIVKQKMRQLHDFGVGKCAHGLPTHIDCAKCEEEKWYRQ